MNLKWTCLDWDKKLFWKHKRELANGGKDNKANFENESKWFCELKKERRERITQKKNNYTINPIYDP